VTVCILVAAREVASRDSWEEVDPALDIAVFVPFDENHSRDLYREVTAAALRPGTKLCLAVLRQRLLSD